MAAAGANLRPASKSSRCHHDPSHGHVILEIGGSFELESRRVIHFNLKPSPVDIELLASARYAEAEPWPAGELVRHGALVARQIERPELAAARSVFTVGYYGIGRLAIGRHFQPQHSIRRRTDRREL